MVQAEMEIVFFSTGNELNGYDADKIKGLTFALDTEKFYIGFVNNQSNVQRYIFNNRYKITVKFPSLDAKSALRVFDKWTDNNMVNVCLGNKIIGEGKVLSYCLDRK